jgi:hypothetical protein
MGTGAKEEESNTGRVRAVDFTMLRPGSRLARVLKLINCLFL